MSQRALSRHLSNIALLFGVAFIPHLAYGDAILSTLFLIWPITLLLFVPVVLIEAIYAARRLRMGFWESVRVLGVANLFSAIAGLPLAYVFSLGLRYVLESIYFHDLTALRTKAKMLGFTSPSGLGPHDTMTLMWLGVYPRWIMLVSAAAMMVLCFLASWWIEGQWVRRHLRNTDRTLAEQCSAVTRNANLLSYAFLTGVFLYVLIILWPTSVKSMIG